MEKEPEKIVALVYDFDKTLCPLDMQNYGFIPAVLMTPSQFWGTTSRFTAENKVEKILSYMFIMIDQARKKGIKLSKGFLKKVGSNIEYFDGVETWFDRINEYANEKGLILEHYIVSSGTKEIIDGSSIAKHFKAIYGCEFHYDEVTGEPVWPKLVINYTQKTQFLFRIVKGVTDNLDDSEVNKRVDRKRIPFKNMLYIGDGMTDIPCMTLVKEKGGKSIAVYPSGQREKVAYLYEEERVNMICSADYSAGSAMEKYVKLFIDSIKNNEDLKETECLASEE